MTALCPTLLDILGQMFKTLILSDFSFGAYPLFSYLCTAFNTMKYTIFLTLEPYLAQWLAHGCGGKDPIPVIRGSAEADLIEAFLKKPPKDPDYVPQLQPLPGQVEILLPCFKHKEVRTYNYLPPRGEICLHECIRNRFKVQLWKDIFSFDNIGWRYKDLIEKWMEDHGIEVDDTNYNTIAKIVQRNRAVYYKNRRLTDHNTSKHKKKS